MQAAQPVHRPEVTTSVKSSAQCGFSGGMALPYRGRPAGPRTAAPGPGWLPSAGARAARGRDATGSWPSGPSGAPSPRSSTPDPWFIKGGADGPALRRALVGHRLVAARRIGKLLLLDIDGGADPRDPVRDDRHPGGGRPVGRRRLVYAPGATTRPGTGSPSASPTAGPWWSAIRGGSAASTLDPDVSRPRARRRRHHPGRAGRRPCAGRRPRSRPGCSTSPGWPASGT